MSSDKEELFRSAYSEYENTYERQLETQASLNEKAIEVIKADLLVGSIGASIITFSPSNLSIPYFIVGAITLLTSIWYCTRVYSPTGTYNIGTSETAFEQMKESEDIESHFKNLAKSYRDNVADFDKEYQTETKHFERGLWFAIATVFLFIIGAGSTVLQSVVGMDYPLTADLVAILAVGIILMYGKEVDKADIGEN